jgi:hypothetical protein
MTNYGNAKATECIATHVFTSQAQVPGKSAHPHCIQADDWLIAYYFRAVRYPTRNMDGITCSEDCRVISHCDAELPADNGVDLLDRMGVVGEVSAGRIDVAGHAVAEPLQPVFERPFG